MRRVQALAVLAGLALLFGGAANAATQTHHARALSPKAYAYQLVVKRGWASQWWAVQEIVEPESHWDPCAYNPVRHDCGYTGSASCGIPQAQPCPWSGRLWTTRYAQVRWLVSYIERRYGNPVNALAFRRAKGWY